MDNRSIQQPIIIRETKAETQSKDLAAIISAASKSNSILSSVWFKKVEPRFSLEPEHIGVAVAFVALSAAAMSAFLDAGIEIVAGMGIASGIIAAVVLGIVSLRNANTTEYEVAYESTAAQSETITRKTYKIDITKGSQRNFIELPEWFEEENVLRLARMARQGVRFNVRNVTDYKVCKQPQFAQLRDGLANAQMLEKSGKSWQLSAAFFAFVEEVEADTD